jgi:hypothetical protein
MLIGSKLPPHRVETTYFSSGRAAFAFLLGQIVRPRQVYLPTFVCWSLVSAMERLFPKTRLAFYPVRRDLSCGYPEVVAEDAALVFIHYFGHENTTPTPRCDGTLLEDMSHSYASGIRPTGNYIFGSYRKLCKVGDGGFLRGHYNPIYEPLRKLDTWLRYEAKDWRDVREAENMLDRQWGICDMSSQSLAIVLQTNEDLMRRKRRENERYLRQHFPVGRPLIEFRDGECPMLHARLFEERDERDSLRQFLATHGVFTSIHWPTHAAVARSADVVDISDTLWLEDHILCIPVSDDYSLNDMEFVCTTAGQWDRAGG